MMNYVFKYMPSPVGRLTLIAGNKGLAAVLWENDRPNRVHAKAEEENEQHPVLLEAERQLQEYFAGNRNSFSLPLDMIGTPFQQQVWEALTTIPHGETRNYQQIANQLGNPKAVRAVGAANGRNPVSIIVPCHRVIGTNGSLTGFAGGLEAKAYLLSLEGVASSAAKTAQLEMYMAE
ncbi:MAG: methylated-DNA--[protein]-cysteine S-methyltransferase [Niastella sp.]|nr:methylated-DNA--[protein]-cysteine S-methyltransferase [Niastella sp.]